MAPLLSRWNTPSREYVVTPLFDIWKKPLPLIAMSSEDFVVLIVPWPNCCCTDVSRVPMPICVLVDVATEFAYMSAKFARPCL